MSSAPPAASVKWSWSGGRRGVTRWRLSPILGRLRYHRASGSRTP